MIMRCSQIGQFVKMMILLLPPHMRQPQLTFLNLQLVSLFVYVCCINYHLFCLVGPTYIIYSKEHSDTVFELSDFLIKHCGVSCDIDQYHMHENIPQWGVWKENKIKEIAKRNGSVLLICSPVIYRQLSEPGVCSQIQMKAGHIDTLTLNNLIRDQATTKCIIPVCLEELNKEIVPSCLRERNIYSLSFSTLMQADPKADLESILDMPKLESLRSLVYRLRGDPEISRPPLGKVHLV